MKFDKSAHRKGMLMYRAPVDTNAQVDHQKSVSSIPIKNDDFIELIKFKQAEIAHKLAELRERVRRARS